MHYLIDGHNLIAQMLDIRLSDPDDEEQLVRRLQSWIAAGRKRRVTLFFDGGLPGGFSPNLSGGSLKVIFASVGRDADRLLITRIKKAGNPPEFTVISSDRAITSVAESRGMPVIDSYTFARMLDAEAKQRSAESAKPTSKEDPSLNESEVARWLALFRGDKERPND